MPWWSWLVIWVFLGLALSAVLTVSAIRLFRKVVRIFDELATLANTTELLQEAADTLHSSAPQIAILRDLAQVQQERRREKVAAQLRRESRHARRVARGRALVRFDAHSKNWFGEENVNR